MSANPLGRLARACHRRPKTVFAIAGLLAAASAAGLLTLKIQQNLMTLLPQDLPSIRAFNDMRENFEMESNLYVLMEGDETASLLEASDAYVEKLRASDLVAAAQNRISEDQRKYFFQVRPRYLFLTLPDEDLKATLDYLDDPAEIKKQMEHNLKVLHSAAPMTERIKKDPLDLATRTRAVERMASAGIRATFTEEGYLLSESGTAVLVTVTGTDAPQNIGYARQLVTFVRQAAPEGMKVSLAGGYAIAVQDEGMIRGDMIQSSVMSSVAIMLLFWLVFRSFGSMMQIWTPLMLAIVWTLGVMVIALGSINPLIAGSIAIMAGLGIDFSIHVMTRFRHELAMGAEREDAVATSVSRVGTGLVVAAATTISVFFSFLASDMKGMSVFGIITGVGIVLCLISTLTVLPAMLAYGKPKPKAILPVLRTGSFNSRIVLVGSGIAFAACIWIGFFWGHAGFSFEPDWKNLRPRDDPALATQERIGELFRGSSESLALLVRGEPLEKLQRLEPRLLQLQKEGVLSAYNSPLAWLPPVALQERNRERLGRVDADAVITRIRTALDEAGFVVEIYEDYLDGLRAIITRRELLTTEVLQREELGGLLEQQLSGDLGLVVLFPTTGLWEREARQQVVQQLRTGLDRGGVEYQLTGFKIISGQLESLLKEDFGRLLLVAGVIVAIISLAMFRDPRLAFLSMFPLLAGLALLAAFMKIGGYHVNVMNLIAFPMVMGLGIDDGIHLVHLYRDSKKDEFDGLVPVTVRAVFLTTVTTVIGFGSLALTQNRGVASMGLVTGIGMICCLLPSFFTLPAALSLLNRRRKGD